MYKKTTLHPDGQTPPTEESVENQRRLSRVLMRLTLLVALVLGMSAGALQLVIELRHEKEAVAHNVEQFLDSVVNSASTAVYNYYDDAAEQVAEGLFTQPAILSVVIEASDSDEPMVTRSRQVQRTLPNFGVLTKADEVTVNRLLREPVRLGNNDIIGSITVKVDRSVVPLWSKMITDSAILITHSAKLISDSGQSLKVITFRPESMITFEQNG